MGRVTAEEVDCSELGEWSRGARPDNVECSFFLTRSAALAARHGAGSRKAAQNRTMSLYGNNRMQRHFLLSGLVGMRRQSATQ